jgi:mannosyltransferase
MPVQFTKPLTVYRHPFAQYALLAAIVVIAAVLRLYRLGSWSFWIDEVITLHRARDMVGQGIGGLLLHPPSTQLIGALLGVMPISEWSARLVPAAIGILSLPLLYFPIRRLFGVSPALIATLLLALSPWHLYWSQNARFYTLLMLFYALSVLYFYIGFEERRPWYLVLSAVFIVLAVWERMSAFFAVPVAIVYIGAVQLWFASEPLRFSPRYIIPALVLPTVGFGLYDTVGARYLGHASVTEVFFSRFVAAADQGGGVVHLAMAIVARLGVPLLCMGTVGGLYLLTSQWSRKSLFLILTVTVPLVLLLGLSTFSLAYERYYTFTALPFWAILCGVAINAMFTRLGRQGPLFAAGVLALLLVDGASQALLYYQYQNGNRPDYRGAYAVVERRGSDDDIVVTTHHQVLIAEHYLGRAVEDAYDVDPNELARRGKSVWFVVEANAGPTPASLLEWLDERARLVDERSLSTPGREVTLQVYLYGDQPMQAARTP